MCAVGIASRSGIASSSSLFCITNVFERHSVLSFGGVLLQCKCAMLKMSIVLKFLVEVYAIDLISIFILLSKYK